MGGVFTANRCGMVAACSRAPEPAGWEGRVGQCGVPVGFLMALRTVSDLCLSPTPWKHLIRKP